MPAILGTWEVEVRRVLIQAQPGQKSLQEPISTEKAGHGGAACHPSKQEDSGTDQPGKK
jgi:hypothetical protein